MGRPKNEAEEVTGKAATLGGNIRHLKEDLVKFRDRIISLKSKRGEINADIKAIMESAESKGIPKKSLRDAIAYYEAAPEQREGYHDGYAICLEAFGMPFNAKQAEMFEDLNKAETAEDEEPEQDDTDEDEDQFAVSKVAKGR